MSAQKYRFKKNRALQDAANLGSHAFKRAALNTPDAATIPSKPTTLPYSYLYPLPDDSMITENGIKRTFMLMREGVILRMAYTGIKNSLTVEQRVGRKGEVAVREMTPEEGVYAMALLRAHLSPADRKYHEMQLDALDATVLFETPYPDKAVEFSAVTRTYSFNRYGYNHTVGTAFPYKAQVSYRDATKGIVETRDMNCEELSRSRRIISSSVPINSSAALKPFFEGLENKQYDLAAAAPR